MIKIYPYEFEDLKEQELKQALAALFDKLGFHAQVTYDEYGENPRYTVCNTGE